MSDIQNSELLDLLYTEQADRLVSSRMDIKTFLAQPEEIAASARIKEVQEAAFLDRLKSY